MSTGYTFWIRGKSMTKLKHKFIVSSEIENMIPADCKRHKLLALLLLSCLVNSAKNNMVETSVAAISKHFNVSEADVTRILNKLASCKNQIIKGYNGGNKVYIQVPDNTDGEFLDYTFEVNLEEYDEEISMAANVLMARLRVSCKEHRNKKPDWFEEYVSILVPRYLLEYTGKEAIKELKNKGYVVKLKKSIFFLKPKKGTEYPIPYIETGKSIMGIAITEKGWGKTKPKGTDNEIHNWFCNFLMTAQM